MTRNREYVSGQPRKDKLKAKAGLGKADRKAEEERVAELIRRNIEAHGA